MARHVIEPDVALALAAEAIREHVANNEWQVAEIR
jgi:predicted transcriptional regulator